MKSDSSSNDQKPIILFVIGEFEYLPDQKEARPSNSRELLETRMPTSFPAEIRYANNFEAAADLDYSQFENRLVGIVFGDSGLAIYSVGTYR